MRLASTAAMLALAITVANDYRSQGIVTTFISVSLHPAPIIAIDGDTIRRGSERYRLVGIDAPEIRTAKCDAERVLGRTAKAWLQFAIWRTSRVEIVATGARDKYGRQLARLMLDSRDAGELLTARGLARQYDGGARRGWCG
jgi:micrococcal nuclease